MKKWIIACGEYAGMEEKAVNLLSGKMREYAGYEIPVMVNADKAALKEYNAVIIGTLSESELLRKKFGSVCGGDEQGYRIEAEAQEDGNTVFIAGNTKAGVYYGAVDFLSIYLPTVATALNPANVNLSGYFNAPFNKVMPPFTLERSPAIKHRAIWTWGHCIFDYRKFFENMSMLKLNEIVIWNDAMPINAKAVVDYAHELGIKVIWGFAWGWDVNCAAFDIADCFDKAKIKKFAESVKKYYAESVLPTGADGIYFQSFTELSADSINGINIAEAVTNWVNGISEELFAAYPDIRVQFGLHATSVKDHAAVIAKTDRRIRIVWEDCGAFPYHYFPDNTADFESTSEFTKKICRLRGENESVGAVFKGMTTLYWDTFKHIEGAFALGENTPQMLDEVYCDRIPAWKFMQAEWIKNADSVKKTTEILASETHGDADIQLLVEYGAFEKAIFFPVALAAEILWQPDLSEKALIERAMLNPYVHFV